MTLIKNLATFKRSTSMTMRTHTGTSLYALIAISCLGSTLCGLITEFGNPLQQSGNVANILVDIIPNGKIDSALGNNKFVKDVETPVVAELTSDLNPVAAIISPIPGELGFFQKFIFMLTKLLSSIKINDCQEHNEDGESTTVATESNETANPRSNESSTVVATEIPIDSDGGVSATQAPVEIEEYDSN